MIKKILPIAIFINFLIIIVSAYFAYNLKESPQKGRGEETKKTLSELPQDIVSEATRTKNIYTANSDPLITTYLGIKGNNLNICEEIKNYKRDETTIQKGYKICSEIIKNGLLNTKVIEEELSNMMDKNIVDEKIRLAELIFNKEKDCSKITQDSSTYFDCKKILDQNYGVEEAVLNFDKLVRHPYKEFLENPEIVVKKYGFEKDIIAIAKKAMDDYYK